MAAILVSYDLHQYGQNYECLEKKLEAYPAHWRFQRSVWMIETDEDESTVAADLIQCLDSNDDLFVTRVSPTAAWWGFAETGDSWFQSVI